MLAFVCGGFGILLLLLVISALREAVAMKRWPVAKGRMLSSESRAVSSSRGCGRLRNRPFAHDAVSAGRRI